jgi:hypothetical protein
MITKVVISFATFREEKKEMAYKLRKLQFILIFLLMICMTTASLYLNVHASEPDNVLVEAMYTDESNLSGSTSSSGYWYSTYCKGGGYLGQGVLIYVLYRNGGGAVEGTTPKAFACSSAVASYTLNAQDKYGRYAPVTQWESTPVHWASTVGNGGGIINSSATSNTAKIKSWLTTTHTADGVTSTNGIAMVKNLWGEAVAEKFTNEEIFLVIEPIIANQFTQSGTNPMQSKIDSLPDNTSMETLVRILRQTENATATIYPQTALSSDLQ